MTNPVADELEIRQLVALYADAVNRADQEQWAATWATESDWSLPGMAAVSGKDNIVGLWVQAMGTLEFVAQLIYQGTITIEGDTAKGRWYLCEHMRPIGSDGGLFNIGTYADEYVKFEGQWLFKRRDYHILYNDEGKGNMSGIVIPLPQP